MFGSHSETNPAHACSGGKVSGASPAYNVEEMTYALKVADAKFIFTSPGSIGVGAASAKEAGLPKEKVFLLEGNIPGYTTIKDLIEIGKSYGESGQIKACKIPPGKKNKDVCGFLSFSSGTTGLPKAVWTNRESMAIFQSADRVIGDDSPSKRNRSVSPNRSNHACDTSESPRGPPSFPQYARSSLGGSSDEDADCRLS